ALVRKEAFDRVPVDAAPRRLRSEETVHGLRRRSAGEHHAAGLLGSSTRDAAHQPLGALAGNVSHTVHDANARSRIPQRPSHSRIKDSAAREASSSERFGVWRWISPTMHAANPR